MTTKLIQRLLVGACLLVGAGAAFAQAGSPVVNAGIVANVSAASMDTDTLIACDPEMTNEPGN
ncbi:MAG: hypothetical protein RXR20_31385 [Paraburkholderia sp.]|jgi:hypothetical protein|uniref:hypothetical protein n=1 Tax=Burkholderiaceae TaxID=119060 RepID=UPI0010F98DD2|nr:hypothetical protein [Burkholderia sp. 4M9327F10]